MFSPEIRLAFFLYFILFYLFCLERPWHIVMISGVPRTESSEDGLSVVLVISVKVHAFLYLYPFKMFSSSKGNDFFFLFWDASFAHTATSIFPENNFSNHLWSIHN